MSNEYQNPCRNFIKAAGLALGAGVVPSVSGLSSIMVSSSAAALSGQPQLTHGIQFGDVLADRVIVWSRIDRPGRIIVEYGFTPDFSDSKLITGPLALDNTDYTARIDLTGLPPGQEILVRVMFQGVKNSRAFSKVSSGHFRTTSDRAKNIRFL